MNEDSTETGNQGIRFSRQRIDSIISAVTAKWDMIARKCFARSVADAIAKLEQLAPTSEKLHLEFIGPARSGKTLCQAALSAAMLDAPIGDLDLKHNCYRYANTFVTQTECRTENSITYHLVTPLGDMSITHVLGTHSVTPNAVPIFMTL